jgi:RimJ/RimL family protein N-acetyltransferase
MVRLEPFGAAHLPGMAALLRDPEVVRFSRLPEPAPPDFLDTWLAVYEQGRRDGTREAFAVLDAGAFVGVALVPRIDAEAGEAELGYMVAAAARGRGIATAALRQLTAWAFGERGLRRLELLIAVDNPVSKRVAAAAGYTHEGVLRSKHLKPGRRVDTEVWSRLPGDGSSADR